MVTEWVLLPMPKEDYAELKQIVRYRQQQRGKAPSPSAEELRGDELAVDTVRRAAFGEHETWPTSALKRLAEGRRSPRSVGQGSWTCARRARA